jgi:transcriptional antiterminator RfaH
VRNWYVVNTHPHQEERAEINLRRQGYDAWLPRLLKSRRHARRVDVTSVPLFPGYLFVGLDHRAQPWRAINSTFGVRRILCLGEQPKPVERGFVEALKQTTDERGVVALPAEGLKLGQPLRLLTGPFADCIGTLLHLADKDRVALLLNLLGREVQVLVSRQQVTAVA